MNKHIPNKLLRELSRRVSGQMGLHFPEGRWLDLLRGVRSAAEEQSIEDVEAYIEDLVSGPLKKRSIEILARHLTVGETYFLREPKVFEALEKKVLPELIRERWQKEKRLRIWSAGCCTGEEAYSIAILLNRMLPDIQNWNIKILATDLNPFFLKKASAGVYREWSFRGAPYWLKENYFKTTEDNSFEILPKIKRMVQFQYLNLVEDVYPSIYNDTNAMDLIFCRNVLMYFSQKQVKRVIHRFHHSLLDNGHLIVASSETSHLFYPKFMTVNYPGAIFYRKDNKSINEGIRFVDNSNDFIGNAILLSPNSLQQVDSSEEDEDVAGTTYVEDYQTQIAVETTASHPEEAEPEILTDMQVEGTPNLEHQYQVANRLYEQGEYAQTVEVIEKIVQQEPDNAPIITLLSKSFANQGKLNDALMWCERVINLEKLNPEGYHLRAVILQEQGNLDEAMTSLKRALYLDPDFTLAYFMLGNLTHQTGKAMESQKYFRNALHLLGRYEREDVLPGSEGMTVGRLTELIQIMLNKGNPA